ncbi:MAG: DUF4214 domain-containing protein [Clostridia bacterium]|nr:DUF4214 domain-containing protein [Clostridia bacterium]
MSKITRTIACLVAFCLMLGGIALAEDYGIGEAATHEAPVIHQDSAVLPATKDAETLSTANTGTAATTTTTPVSNDTGTRGFVTRMYKVVLDRDPDPNGLDYWVNMLDSGKLQAADIVTGFFNSTEYTGKNKKNEEVVKDCFNAMLGRDPDQSGMTYWKAIMDYGMTSDRVCAGFLGSQEFIGLANSYGIKPGTITLKNARDLNIERTAFVYRLYQDCLKRKPDVNGLENWCKQLSNGYAGTAVASGFVFSNEYKNTLPSNEEYIDMLYRTIMGREPDQGGKTNWVNQLNYTISREKALNGFMFSPEFSAKCSTAGIKVGNKVKEPDTTRAWKANILVLSLVNAERAKVGAAALTTREDLWEKVAMVRAEELNKVWGHNRPNGKDCWSAYTDAGFDDAREAENIAFDSKGTLNTEQKVMKAWMESAGHKANILDTKLTTLATGYYKKNKSVYWSQNFYTE